MSPETLKPHELISKRSAIESSGHVKLNGQKISALIQSRKEILENIKDGISRKIYFQIEEKINREEKQLKEILDWQEGRQSVLAKYSFILDPHYFEQEFLN